MKMKLTRNFRCIAAAAVFMVLFVLISSSMTVRNWIVAPLVVHEGNARGDACYVLAGGGSIWERLDAASDLHHLHRVSRILLMRDDKQSQFSFKANMSWTRSQWMQDYLAWRGVPAGRVVLLQQVDTLFGTLNEARAVARQLPGDVKTLVVVSSAPHMRRTVLAFQRSLPADVKIVPYAATSFETSHEMTFPIWIEYAKLLVYFVIA